jgi:aconitate hydratase
VDEKTIEYMKLTHRGDRAEAVEACARAMGLFYTGDEEPEYTDVLEVDLDAVEPSLAGPARPQDRIPLNRMKNAFLELMGCEHERDTDVDHMSKFLDESGSTTSREDHCEPSKRETHDLELNGRTVQIGDGSVVIAAITSCTNTSNPFVLLGAGLLAKKAVERGLRVPAHVKTSLVPGSRVVVDYLKDSRLMPYLEALGFHLAGFGCTTCIGNSGPLHPDIEKLIAEKGLTVAAVLSGNRNFEARIHQRVKGNYLGSPILVVAYALAGRVDVNLAKEPLGLDPNGEPVYLKDIWPWPREIEPLIRDHVKPEFYAEEYAKIFDGDEFWQGMKVTESTTFDWDGKSTYIKNPPYFEGFDLDVDAPGDIEGALVLAVLGDSVTTDHISPAGAIPEEYPAGKYLIDKGVAKVDFNSYGSRRGNHEVMMRGTFGNIRIKNQLVEGKEGSHTKKFPEDETMYIFDAAEKYAEANTPLIVLGGKEYGTGSSRDWAAKGTLLLGVKAVIAESYERIHRSNLVGMGVLPLQFRDGEGWERLGLDGTETYAISGIADMTPRKTVKVRAEKRDGSRVEFEAVSRLNTDIDVAYYRHGGILPYVLRKMMKES